MKILSASAILGALMMIAAPLATATQSTDSQPHLKVGVYVHEPFVILSGQEYRGFSIDLWREIAADLGRGTDFTSYSGIPELLEAVSSGKVDVGVSGIFVTEDRLKIVEFSQPFLQGGLQIMVHEKRGSPSSKSGMA